MGTLPSRSTTSITSYMQGIKIKDKTEKGLMVRIGTLIDAVTNVQRGHSNAAAGLDRRSLALNNKRPPKVVAETENVFNGAAVTIDPIRSAAGLSTYEVQIDSDPNFSNPTTKVAFNKNIIFKGLESGTTYNLRVRGLTKGGQAGPWSILDPVITTPSAGETTADFDGYLEEEGRVSKTFTFDYNSEQVFAMANFGLEWIRQGGGDGVDSPLVWQDPNVPSASLSVLTSMVMYDDFVTSAFGDYFGATLTAPLLTEDTSGVDYAPTFGEIIRYYPIMMFPIFDLSAYITFVDPDYINFTFPVATPYTNFFQVNGVTGTRPIGATFIETLPERPTNNPVVWIKFGSLT